MSATRKGRDTQSSTSAYLKLVKNNPKTKGNDSLGDYDYGEEDSEEWETEDEESEEPDADGGSAEEDDEDSVK